MAAREACLQEQGTSELRPVEGGRPSRQVQEFAPKRPRERVESFCYWNTWLGAVGRGEGTGVFTGWIGREASMWGGDEG